MIFVFSIALSVVFADIVHAQSAPEVATLFPEAIEEGEGRVSPLPREEESCVSLASRSSDFKSKEEITYIVTFRNGCNETLEDGVLSVALPPEINFSYTNYSHYARDAGVLIYELGKVPGKFQLSIVVQGSMAVQGEPFTIRAEFRATEHGRVVKASTVLDVRREDDTNTLEIFGHLAAKVTGALQGIMRSMWFWIAVAPVMIFSAGYFAFGKNGKRKKEEMSRSTGTDTQVPLPPPRA